MLLAVDIGNTQTHIGAFEGEELAHDWRLGTDAGITSDELAATLRNLLELEGLGFDAIDAAIVSTVVPQLGPEYRRLCERHIKGDFVKVGPNLMTGMPILVDNPHELGADRLVNAVAAHARVKGACVTVDFGTSTNFDVVSGQGEYLGGVIGPGVEISLEALTARTAKLPRIDVSDPGSAIGRNTVAAIQSGFAYGFAGLVDGINRRLAEELGEETTNLATGGLAATIAPQCETIDEVDPLLTLRGLRLIWELNSG
jgi:type III pantothenate kinase